MGDGTVGEPAVGTRTVHRRWSTHGGHLAKALWKARRCTVQAIFGGEKVGQRQLGRWISFSMLSFLEGTPPENKHDKTSENPAFFNRRYIDSNGWVFQYCHVGFLVVLRCLEADFFSKVSWWKFRQEIQKIDETNHAMDVIFGGQKVCYKCDFLGGGEAKTLWARHIWLRFDYIVDGRNPVPVDMVNIPLLTRFQNHPNGEHGLGISEASSVLSDCLKMGRDS